MSNEPKADAQEIEDSQHEARDILQDALDAIADAAYTIGSPLNLLPKNEEGDVEFDENDLEKTGHPTLVAIAKVAHALYAALETLPPAPDDEDDLDDEGEDEGDEGEGEGEGDDEKK